jgi:hypothetical protein
MDAARYQRARRPKPYAIGVKAEERTRGTPRQEQDVDPTALEPPGDRPAAEGDGREATLHERCIHHPGRALDAAPVRNPSA